MGAEGEARRLHAGSNGLRTEEFPAARAARSTGLNTTGNMCVCLCAVNMRESQSAALQQFEICAVASASILQSRSVQ